MRICVVIPDLRAGGAQRVISTLTEELRRRDHQVTVITFDTEANDHFKLRPDIERFSLGGFTRSGSVAAALAGNARRVVSVRRAIRGQRPDAVLSFIDSTNVVTILATRRLGVPVVVSERIHPPRYRMRQPWPLLRRLTYPFADVIVMQTDRGRHWAERLVDPNRISVISNPLAPQFLAHAPSAMYTRARTIVAAGRLEAQKGFDLLIDAFASSRAPAQGWTLTIHGHGSQEAELRARATGRGVGGSVRVTGALADLEHEFANAQIFVLSSRFEGFPNVLVEAMACGCAVITTDCETGPADVVTERVDGLLVQPESVSAIQRAIDELIADDALRIRIGLGALHVRERFAPNEIASQWADLLIASTSRGQSR